MTQILKANQVSTTGQVKLNVNTQTASNAHCTIAAGSAPTANPTARIVETTEKHAIIEVTCQCGQVNLVKCDY